jgi:hypothetical protein
MIAEVRSGRKSYRKVISRPLWDCRCGLGQCQTAKSFPLDARARAALFYTKRRAGSLFDRKIGSILVKTEVPMGLLKIEGVTHWSIPVNNLAEAEKFYGDLLGLKPLGRLGNSGMSCFNVGDHNIRSPFIHSHSGDARPSV